jgi:hemoglobin
MRRPFHRARAAAIAAALCLAGCGGPPALYDRLGGFATMEHLGDSLVIDIGRDPVLIRRFQGFSIADVQRQRSANVAFACALAGGPCRYDGPAIAEIHRGMSIDDSEFDRMIALFAAAARRASPDPQAATEFVARFEALRPAVVEKPAPGQGNTAISTILREPAPIGPTAVNRPLEIPKR